MTWAVPGLFLSKHPGEGKGLRVQSCVLHGHFRRPCAQTEGGSSAGNRFLFILRPLESIILPPSGPQGWTLPAPTVAPQWTGFGYFHGESTFLVQRFLGLQPLRRADPQCCRHSSDPDESPSEKGSSLVAGTAHSAICSSGLVSAGCPICMVLSPLGSDPLS